MGRIEWHDSDTRIYADTGSAVIDGLAVTVAIEEDYETSSDFGRGTWGEGTLRRVYNATTKKHEDRGSRSDVAGALRAGALHSRDSRGVKWHEQGTYSLWRPFEENTVRYFLHDGIAEGLPLREARKQAIARAMLEMQIAKGGQEMPISIMRVGVTVKKAGVTLFEECAGSFDVAGRYEPVAAKWYDTDFSAIYEYVESEMLDNALHAAKAKLAELLK